MPAQKNNGLRSKKKRYYLRDPKRLRKDFYSHFDFDYWRYKLLYLDLLVSVEELPPGLGSQDPPLEIEKWKRYINKEVHFTYHHLLECLFALLFSQAPGRNPWLYLTTYSSRDLGNDVKKLSDGDYLGLFNVETFEELAFQHIYHCYIPERTSDLWKKSVTVLEELFGIFIHDYYSGKDDYNSFKHGLRVSNSENQMAIGLEDGTGRIFPVGNNKNSSFFLTLKEEASLSGEDAAVLSVHQTVVGFDPARDFRMAWQAFRIIKGIVLTAKGLLDEENEAIAPLFDEIEIYELNKTEPGIYSSTFGPL